MGQQTNKGYKLDQTGQQTQDAINKIINLTPGHLESIGIYYGTTEYWNSRIGYIPEEGTIIIYSDYAQRTIDGVTVNVPGIKVGSGNAYVQDLVFAGDADYSRFMNHITNNAIHITNAERAKWSDKLNVQDDYEVVDDTLVFNRE